MMLVKLKLFAKIPEIHHFVNLRNMKYEKEIIKNNVQ